MILNSYQPPMITVKKPVTIDPPCAVKSPTLAAGFPPIKTVVEPITIVSGGPAQEQISPTHAAGELPINTVGEPGAMIGPPTCGEGPLNMGQM
jgi:hypothetical protein